MDQICDSEAPSFTAADLRRRAEGVLMPRGRVKRIITSAPAPRGDYDLNPGLSEDSDGGVARRPAAVLVPIVDRAPEATVLLTVRTEALPAHAGQIAFPGGKMDPGDPAPAETALREAEEEIGLDRSFVDLIGFLEPYQTVTGFRIAPAVGIVSPGFSVVPDGTEVAEVFEVPLRFLMDPANHRRHHREWGGGGRRYFYAMPYGDRYIWGATAGMLRNLYDWLYG